VRDDRIGVVDSEVDVPVRWDGGCVGSVVNRRHEADDIAGERLAGSPPT